MDERRELRKFPRGERCLECGVRRWYLENGLRFCSNGHQVEGFIQFDIGDEEDAGKLGAVAKRDKEVKGKALRHLTGQAGKNLYLECLQLILRSQIVWLVDSKNHREELETVVRDLWDLRTRGSSNLVDDDAPQEGGMEMFSSQPDAGDQSNGFDSRGSRAQSWNPERGPDWPMPRMKDTLALCYLGCLLLHIPTSIGEICSWVNEGHMPYKRAYYDLPQEMQDRLPSAYTRALKRPLRATLQGIGLNYAIMDLALSYHHNYGMIFPSVNATLILIHYTKQLALPVEALVTSRIIVSILQTNFKLPIEKSRLFNLDYPEIMLAAIVIVATKLCFPLGSHLPLIKTSNSGQDLRFDWDKWQAAMAGLDDSMGPSGNEHGFDNITADAITSMSPDQLTKYFAHVASLIDKRNENTITRFFPSENAPSLEWPREQTTEDEMDNRTRGILAQVFRIFGEGQLGSNSKALTRSEATYVAFRSIEDLTESSKALYTKAGHLAGLTLQEILSAVYTLEQRILTWQGKQEASEEMSAVSHLDC